MDTKYGDHKIDISDIQNHSPEQKQSLLDPSRPAQIDANKFLHNEPLPSYSNRVSIGEFSVGHFKEF